MSQPRAILISGPPGSGKSTLAYLLQSRLNTVELVGTDTIRDVLRFARDRVTARPLLNPQDLTLLSAGSYRAWTVQSRETRTPAPVGIRLGRHGAPAEEEVAAAFLTQTQLITPIVASMTARAVAEKYSLIIEGVHCVIDHVDSPTLRDHSFCIFLDCEDEEQHRLRFTNVPAPRARPRNTQWYHEQPNWDGIRVVRDALLRNSSRADLIVDSAFLTPDAVVERVLQAIGDLDCFVSA